MKILNKQEAIDFSKQGKYHSMSLQEIAEFQAQQPLLCVPFPLFHQAVEHVAGHPVWTHEFADQEYIKNLVFGEMK